MNICVCVCSLCMCTCTCRACVRIMCSTKIHFLTIQSHQVRFAYNQYSTPALYCSVLQCAVVHHSRLQSVADNLLQSVAVFDSLLNLNSESA